MGAGRVAGQVTWKTAPKRPAVAASRALSGQWAGAAPGDAGPARGGQVDSVGPLLPRPPPGPEWAGSLLWESSWRPAFMWGCGKVSGQPLTASQKPGLSQPAGHPLRATPASGGGGGGTSTDTLPAEPWPHSPWARKGPLSDETLGSPAPCPPQRSYPDSELAPHARRAFGEPPHSPPLWWSRSPALWDMVSGRACLGLTALPPSLTGLRPQLGRLARVQDRGHLEVFGGPGGEGQTGNRAVVSTCCTQAVQDLLPGRLGIPRRRQDHALGAGGRPGPSCLMRSHSARCPLAPESRLSLLH